MREQLKDGRQESIEYAYASKGWSALTLWVPYWTGECK
jgi:hypothetical protein